MGLKALTRRQRDCADHALALEIDDPGCWMEALQQDLLNSAADFTWLATQLRADSDIRVRRAGHLTE
jgi:hypothetical protein